MACLFFLPPGIPSVCISPAVRPFAVAHLVAGPYHGGIMKTKTKPQSSPTSEAKSHGLSDTALAACCGGAHGDITSLPHSFLVRRAQEQRY